jgi:hypothetical protein
MGFVKGEQLGREEKAGVEIDFFVGVEAPLGDRRRWVLESDSWDIPRDVPTRIVPTRIVPTKILPTRTLPRRTLPTKILPTNSANDSNSY